MESRFEISWSTLWKILFMAIVAMTLFWVRDVIMVLLFAIVISAALDSPVSFLEKRKVPRVFGAIFLFLMALTLFAALLYTIIPVLIIESENFIEMLGTKEIPILGGIDTEPILQKFNSNIGELANALFSGGNSFFNIVSGIFGNITLVILVLMLSFYLTVDKFGVEKFLRAILTLAHEEYVVDVYLRVKNKMGYWMRGQIVTMIFVGILSFAGLLILGVKYSLLLGIIAGLFEIIPIAGPIFAGALAFLVAISISWKLGIYVIILFLIIQQIENHILVPLIMRKAVGLSPIVVVLFILAGAKIAGIAGIILAVPVAVTLNEILLDWERKKILAAKQENLDLRA
jgi:predicted PurR-regulated permease PerM